MSNSSLVTYTRLSKNKTARRSKIDSIIIHCIVGQWTAKQGCDYFATTNRQSSANYVVGHDGSIGLSVEEAYRAWTSGGTDKNGNPIRVNGISGADFDHRAITIEVASDTFHPYAVTDKAYAALIELCADICKRNGIPQLLWRSDKKYVGTNQQNMGAHRWFANKACPGDYLYSRMGDIADRVNEKLKVCKEEPESSVSVTYEIGDEVNFVGTKHYVSSNSNNAKTCKPGPARVTALAKTGKHPIHLAALSGKGSTVYGWVDAENVMRETAILAVGSKVQVNSGAKTYTGGKLSSFVYQNTYDVLQINGDRVVIGIGKAVTAAMHKKDLTVV